VQCCPDAGQTVAGAVEAERRAKERRTGMERGCDGCHQAWGVSPLPPVFLYECANDGKIRGYEEDPYGTESGTAEWRERKWKIEDRKSKIGGKWKLENRAELAEETGGAGTARMFEE
jgi:hypothetical protein